MTYRVRSLQEIVDGELATVVANSAVTDVNEGSVVRTIIEASALQDADQYLQIARLKNAFSIESATGTDLDERGDDYGITRLTPSQSTGLVKFGDSNVTVKRSTTLAASYGSGVTSIAVANSSAFPSTGSVVLERDTSGQRETVVYTANVANVLTLASATLLGHASGTSVILSTAGADRVFSSGSVVSVPATDSASQIDFATIAAATLLDGEVYSNAVTVLSQLTGTALNVGTGQIVSLSSPPFPTATVTNDANTQGGRDVESDKDYRQRMKQTIAALSNGTVNDLIVAASAVSLASGQRVLTVQVVEEFFDPDVSVYVDDGTGAVTATSAQTSLEILLQRAEAGQRRARVSNWPVVSGTLNLKRSTARGLIITVTPGVGTATCNVPGAGFTPAAFVGLKVIDDNRNVFTITANTANDFTVTVSGPSPVPGAFAILPATFLTIGTDYLFNETTGDIELVSGLLQYDALCAVPNPTNAYTYYTGLIQEVQKVLKGDPANLATYPGVAAAGVKVKVRAPTLQLLSFSLTVLSALGTVEASLSASVKDAVQSYVNGLGVGGDVVLAEIIAAVMAIDGITDVSVNSPSNNVIILDGSLPRTKASLITVL